MADYDEIHLGKQNSVFVILIHICRLFTKINEKWKFIGFFEHTLFSSASSYLYVFDGVSRINDFTCKGIIFTK